MIKNSNLTKSILVLIAISFISCGPTDQSNKTLEVDSTKRLEKVEELNTFVKENKLKARFAVDPNDNTTLVFYRESTMSAENIDFKTSVFGYGTTIEDLKKLGFNKVRVYSSRDGYKKYALTIL